MSERCRALILGLSGTALSEEECHFFKEADPLGFILFARNIESLEQTRALTESLRELLQREDAPILVDQEGGRVQRLRPPHWRLAPAAERFGKLAQRDLPKARRAVYLNHRLLADDLVSVGITVNCAPVLDLRHAGAHHVIGDRAYGADPLLVADLGRSACQGLADGGVQPVIKHIPGHGRGLVDSHIALPVCEASESLLAGSDFLPFRLLRDQHWAMTAHVVYETLDAAAPATTSPEVIELIVRGAIGFSGILVSDDISMEALSGSIGTRTRASIAAGCDLALHCNGRMEEMAEAAMAAGPMSRDTMARLKRSRRGLAPAKAMSGKDRKLAVEELEGLLHGA